jgi:hypothetical protein
MAVGTEHELIRLTREYLIADAIREVQEENKGPSREDLFEESEI